MIDYKIELINLRKKFANRNVFNEINYEFRAGNVYGIAGGNGAGKSTLTKIIAGVLSPTKGKVVHFLNKKEIVGEKLHRQIGFVSPYLVLYDEFTAEENLKLFSQIRGIHFDEEYNFYLLKIFGLYGRRKDLLKGYSSGMLQRMKFVFALQHKPNLLLLDEPTSNLDSKGKEAVYNTIEEYGKEKLVIVASNENNDLALCKEILNVEDYKKGGVKN